MSAPTSELWRHKKSKQLWIVPIGWEQYATEDDYTAVGESFKYPSLGQRLMNMHNYEKVPQAEADEIWGDRI